MQVQSICFIGPKSKIRNVLRGVLQSGYHMASSTAAPVVLKIRKSFHRDRKEESPVHRT